ncbi:FAD-binding oxidoreductase [Herbaspirillum sp. BH-1]|uniref:FAD/FMN-containing dehydrogenase n=1 Tax=Herbaspirillum frisingense TaxID=92645 RepID=A0ABU1PJ06_9BURK|nr:MULTISPECIES: FAD-binding oxidoreductase [Herbaspirillum]MDR6585750.1 FAD/FMN-containing dehydrogenase [Herbaspirillum frisingense]PLY61337.1 FAD-binding oxidoreductase [Herbaspirillum sp. BH-1]
MSENTQELIRQLHAIVGDAGLVTEAEAQAPYLKDWLGKWQGRVAVVVRPADTAQTAEVVRLCHLTHTPIVTQGGNTGMSGGATPDDSGAQVILSTTRMNRVREVDPINNTMTVDAGVILAHAQEAARDAGRYFPLSLGAEGSCTVGGNLATNAGGIAVLRFGNMRELALGLEVVLPDGRIWNGLRGLRKDNTGYDLRDLFIGSEGTLGVITGAVLKLFSQPHARATAWVGADSPAQLAELLARTRARCGDRLVAFEMMSAASLALVLQHVTDTRAPLAQATPYNALIELADTEDLGLQAMLEEVLGQALEDETISDAMFCTSGTQAAALWKIREGISQAQVRAGKVIKHDIALPISAIAGFVAQAEALIDDCGLAAQIINFGHLGDGNLHFNVMIPLSSTYEDVKQATLQLNRLVHDLVTGMQGSISAEHGVGQLRRDELQHYKSPLEMELMLRIKQAFDPNLIMNPGKLL